MRARTCHVTLLLAWSLLGCSQPAVLQGHLEVEGGDATGLVVDYRTTRVQTGAAGDFDLAGPLPVTLRVSGTGIVPSSQTVVVRTADDAQLHFVAVGTVTGTLTRAGLARGNSDLTVTIVGAPHATGSLDDAGHFEFSNVPAGEHLLIASAPGFLSYVSSPFTVTRGLTTELPSATLETGTHGPTGSLVGVVHEPGSDDSSQVDIFVEGTKLHALSAADGSYRIDAVPEGSYTLRFTHHGHVERLSGVVSIQGREGFIATPALLELAALRWNLQELEQLFDRSATWCQQSPNRLEWAGPHEFGWLDDAGVHHTHTPLDEVSCPLVLTSGQLLWKTVDGQLETEAPDGGARPLVSPAYLVTQLWPRGNDTFAVSGYLPESNKPVLYELSLDGGTRLIQQLDHGNDSFVGARWVNERLYYVVNTYQSAFEPRAQANVWSADTTQLRQLANAYGTSFSLNGVADSYIVVQGADLQVFRSSTAELLASGERYQSFFDPPYFLSFTWNSQLARYQGTQHNVDTGAETTLVVPSSNSVQNVVCQDERGSFVALSNALVHFTTDGGLTQWAGLPSSGAARCVGDGAIWVQNNTVGSLSLMQVVGDEPTARELVRDDIGASSLSEPQWAGRLERFEFWFLTRRGDLKRVSLTDGSTTVVAKRVLSATFSPSGQQLAVVVSTERGSMLSVMNADGSDPVPLSEFANTVPTLSWFDEQQLAVQFSAGRQLGVWLAHLPTRSAP